MLMSEHEGLAPYERGTQKWIGQIGHWHVTDINGRRWIKGPVSDCAAKAAAKAKAAGAV